jgi:uncharacterized NAD(P)/FAD-binding protein YdhS
MGRGVAYSTTEPSHVLNVRAEGMSAWADDPGHFAEFFARTENGGRRDFAQRGDFATYLAKILDEAVASGLTRPIEANVTRASSDNGGWQLGLEDGSMIKARAVVLALGNQDPEWPGALPADGSRFIGNPWGSAARDAIVEASSDGKPVLMIGTGLTMVDLVLSLDAAGDQGKMVAISRRGLIPRSHADFEPAPVVGSELPSGLLGLSRWLRRRGAQVGWRAAVDSLRPHSRDWWQDLSEQEQRRFMRHARPWWDVHRHRIAPEVAGTIQRLVSEGRLQIIAGQIVSAKEGAEGANVEYRRRGSDESQTASFAYVFSVAWRLHRRGGGAAA